MRLRFRFGAVELHVKLSMAIWALAGCSEVLGIQTYRVQEVTAGTSGEVGIGELCPGSVSDSDGGCAAAGAGGEPGMGGSGGSEPTPVVAACGALNQACCSDASAVCNEGLGCQSSSNTCVPCASFNELRLFPGHFTNFAHAVSANGLVVVGYGSSPNRALRWTEQGTSVQALGTLDAGTYSFAFATNADGSVVVGRANDAMGISQAIRWTEADGMLSVGAGAAYGVSADGTVVAASGAGQAFQWTPAGGVLNLGFFYNGTTSRANAISSDGSVIVGEADSLVFTREAFRWEEESGLIGLGALAEGTYSYATATSADGLTIVGAGDSPTHLQPLEEAAFRWTDSDGMTELPIVAEFPNPQVNADGSVVVGTSREGAFIWDAASGSTRLLADVLAKVIPVGWTLNSAAGISSDGRVVVGNGERTGDAGTSGFSQGWMAVIGEDCAVP